MTLRAAAGGKGHVSAGAMFRMPEGNHVFGKAA
jgi:hypothetical protein